MEAGMKIGWIGMGRMGYAMALRLLQKGHALRVWNRTRAKAEPLAQHGATLVQRRGELAGSDVLFTMLSTGKDLEEVLLGTEGVIAAAAGRVPGVIVDCSTIGVEESAHIRASLGERGGERQSALRRRREALQRGVRSARRLRARRASHQGVLGAGRVLRGRG
jgi:3-hydroxyisobutyrate dehydrogenase